MSQTTPEFVQTTTHDGIVVLRLDRPPANAVEIQMALELAKALEAVRANDRTAAVVLTGTGDCFSAGLDLKVVPAYDVEQRKRMTAVLDRMVHALYSLPLPVLAAVNGHAVAAGTLMTLACDYRIGPQSDARFGLTGVRVGIPYPESAMAIIQAELPPAAARALLLSARTVSVDEARAYGIVDEVVPLDRVLPRTLEQALDMASMPAENYAATKNQVRRATISRLNTALGPAPAPPIKKP